MKYLLPILLTFLLISTSFAIDSEDQERIRDCGPWVNCNYNPPNFDGTCCRICFFEDLGYREWQCAVHTNDVGFTKQERTNLKSKFLYDCENRDIREYLIMELNTKMD